MCSLMGSQMVMILVDCAGLSVGSRRFAVRTALALGALLTARFVPFLGLVMALIGSFLTIAVRCACLSRTASSTPAFPWHHLFHAMGFSFQWVH